jgi:hypothetical protein
MQKIQNILGILILCAAMLAPASSYAAKVCVSNSVANLIFNKGWYCNASSSSQPNSAGLSGNSGSNGCHCWCYYMGVWSYWGRWSECSYCGNSCQSACNDIVQSF